MRLLYAATMSLTLWMVSTPSMALIKAMALYGQRTGNLELEGGGSEDLKGSEVGLALHLDPIPLVPVSLGVGITQQSFDVSLTKHNVSELRSLIITPEVQAWLNIPGIPVAPFARAGYSIATYNAKGRVDLSAQGQQNIEFDQILTSMAPRIGVGLKYAPLPLPVLDFNIVLEYAFGTETFKEKEIEAPNLGSASLPQTLEGATYKSSVISIGIEAGI